MKKTAILSILVLCVTLAASALWASSASAPSVTAEEALNWLKEGNSRYVSGAMTHQNQNQDRRSATVAEGQHPFVTMLGCSDSRVPVEVLFDRGIGDLFVIRVAGNVADTDEIGSIEYGTDHLGTPLLVVLGHTRCGAVTAVVKGEKVHGHIPPLVANIKPAVAKAKAKAPGAAESALVEEAVKANVWQAVEDVLKNSLAVRMRIGEGKLKVMGAIYDLESGKVEWLGAHPNQEALLKEYGAKDKKHH